MQNGNFHPEFVRVDHARAALKIIKEFKISAVTMQKCSLEIFQVKKNLGEIV